ncbi:MAG: PD-(D/E)XK motif protein [Mycolicibacter algericus]|uniref:PD-(D/E)XK motif protein n=1 Tax=Mycolicibacter algericus TaxID=1288388 RepID=UPI003C756304
MTEYELLVARRWRQIEDEEARSSGGWRAMPLPVVAYGRELIQAIDVQGVHHLLIPADVGPHPENIHSPLAMSFGEFHFKTSADVDVTGRYLDVRCRLSALNKQFDTVIGEVVKNVAGSKRPINAAVTTLAAWRQLFTNLADVRPLTHQQKLAAFGELSVLHDLVVQFPEFRVAAWTGPQRTPHDFELPTISLEVKTIGEDSDTITVHGLDQLAATDDKPLYLVIRQVVEAPGGRTVAELLGDIVSGCDEPALARERAARIGVYEGMEDTTRFEVVASLVGDVGADFPRITRYSLSPDLLDAVGNITYTLVLPALRDRLVRGFGEVLRRVIV